MWGPLTEKSVTAKSYIFYEYSMFIVDEQKGQTSTTLQHINPEPLVEIQVIAKQQLSDIWKKCWFLQLVKSLK